MSDSANQTQHPLEPSPERKAIDQALREAVREALLQHKRAGNPVVFWKDGKRVIVPAEKIPVDDK